jgi:hypothetical protein
MKGRDPDNELWVNWSKREHDIQAHYPRSCDGNLLLNFFCTERLHYSIKQIGAVETGKSLIKELEERGYDITTLKFSIKKKKNI